MEVDHQGTISDALGFSLFYLMENNEQEKIFELLTFHEDLINLEIKNKYGATPLHVAAFLGLVDTVELLLQAGVSVSVRTNKALTPLHCAIMDFYHYDGFGNSQKIDYHRHTKNHCLIAEMLLKSGADPNSFDINNMTPLHYATGENHYFVIELLVNYHANIFAENKRKQRPFCMAVERSYRRTIFTFIKTNYNIIPEWQKEKMIKIIRQIDSGAKISVWDFCQDSKTESVFDTSGICQDLFKAFELYYRRNFQ